MRKDLQLVYNLRGCIERSAKTSVSLRKRGYLFADAEVCDFEESRWGYEDVVGFDVSMENAIMMEVFQSHCYLNGQVDDLRLVREGHGDIVE